jgi:hypothetical protein
LSIAKPIPATFAVGLHHHTSCYRLFTCGRPRIIPIPFGGGPAQLRHDEIVEEIGRLTETTANLKNQLEKPKSKLDRFKEYAGVVSLLLSLATGFFAIYTSFVEEPEKSKADAQARLHDTLAQIVTLDQEYMREVQQGDPNANNGALESKRNILLQQAEDLANRRGVASSEDQLNLGNEYEFGRRLELALAHFNAALRLAGNDPLMRATADTRIGKLNFYGIDNSTKLEGRQRFQDAENVLSKPTTMQAGIALVQSLGIRSWVECSFGDPGLGLQARTKAEDELKILARDPAVSPQLIDTYKVSLATGLNNTHCAEASSTATPATAAALPSAGPSIPSSTNKIDLSNQMMRLLISRNYSAFEANMTATARSQVPETRLQSIWEQVSAITGPYSRTIETKTTVVNDITYYIVHAQCERALVNLALAFDEANRVSFLLVTPLSSLPKQEIEHRATGIASAFLQQRFDDVFAGFDANLKSQLPVERLQSFFAQLTNTSGHFEHVIGAAKNRDLDIVDVLCQLQGGRAVIRVAYDPDMQINGFVILPGS